MVVVSPAGAGDAAAAAKHAAVAGNSLADEPLVNVLAAQAAQGFQAMEGVAAISPTAGLVHQPVEEGHVLVVALAQEGRVEPGEEAGAAIMPVSYLSLDQLSRLPGSVIPHLTATDISSLSSSQIGAISTSGIAIFAVLSLVSRLLLRHWHESAVNRES